MLKCVPLKCGMIDLPAVHILYALGLERSSQGWTIPNTLDSALEYTINTHMTYGARPYVLFYAFSFNMAFLDILFEKSLLALR